jgi:hypothetical protein
MRLAGGIMARYERMKMRVCLSGRVSVSRVSLVFLGMMVKKMMTYIELQEQQVPRAKADYTRDWLCWWIGT